MLKGADAVVLHVLQELGVPATIVRMWERVSWLELAWHGRGLRLHALPQRSEGQ